LSEKPWKSQNPAEKQGRLKNQKKSVLKENGNGVKLRRLEKQLLVLENKSS
jgi:hypothetical protein